MSLNANETHHSPLPKFCSDGSLLYTTRLLPLLLMHVEVLVRALLLVHVEVLVRALLLVRVEVLVHALSLGLREG